MTVIVALTYPGGAVIASDTRRMDASARLVESDRFSKTLRRDWDHPQAVNAVHRLVIGGIAGQMMHGHLRLTAAIEAACTAEATLAALEQHLLSTMADTWIRGMNDSDIVLAASPSLDATGQPELRHLRGNRGSTVATLVPVPQPQDCWVVGSGAAAALQVLQGQQWLDGSSADALARRAVEAAIGVGGGCGGTVSVEKWP